MKTLQLCSIDDIIQGKIRYNAQGTLNTEVAKERGLRCTKEIQKVG